MIQVTS